MAVPAFTRPGRPSPCSACQCIKFGNYIAETAGHCQEHNCDTRSNRKYKPFFTAISSSRLTQQKFHESGLSIQHGLAHSCDQSSFTLQHPSQHSHTSQLVALFNTARLSSAWISDIQAHQDSCTGGSHQVHRGLCHQTQAGIANCNPSKLHLVSAQGSNDPSSVVLLREIVAVQLHNGIHTSISLRGTSDLRCICDQARPDICQL